MDGGKEGGSLAPPPFVAFASAGLLPILAPSLPPSLPPHPLPLPSPGKPPFPPSSGRDADCGNGKRGQGGRDRKGKWRGESRRRRKEHFCSPLITPVIDCESFRRIYQVTHTPIFITKTFLSTPIHSDGIEKIECELRTLSSLMIFYWVSLFARRAESSGEQRGGGGKRGRQSEISRSREMGWAGGGEGSGAGSDGREGAMNIAASLSVPHRNPFPSPLREESWRELPPPLPPSSCS